MLTIYKYPLTEMRTEIEMPLGEILKCDYDPQGQLCLWAVVDTNSEKEIRTFVCIGTGWPLDEYAEKYDLDYIDTIKEGPYVWHVCELIKKPGGATDD